MPKYKYACSSCSKEYFEQRLVEHPQFKTHCDICGAEYTEITE